MLFFPCSFYFLCGLKNSRVNFFGGDNTTANEHDVTQTSKLLHGEEKEVYGKSGYTGADKREDAVIHNKNGKKINYKINRKPSQIKKLSASGQYAEKKAE